jgi:hypothetical protein
MQHEHYPILYFHNLLTQPPFPRAFIYVMTAVTVPVPVLVTFVLGVVLALVASLQLLVSRVRGVSPSEIFAVPLKGRVGGTGWAAMLLIANAAYPFSFWLQNTTPIFGGTKHWMNGLPFLCILGAWSLAEGVARARLAFAKLATFGESRLVAAFGAACMVPGVFITARVHPYGLSAYNELVGFARGAANVGFQRTFWGHEPRLVLPVINERTPRSGRILFGDTNYDDHRTYVRDGLLRRDIGVSGAPSDASVASVQPQGEFKTLWTDVMNTWQTTKPDEVVHVEGVPLVTVTFRK